MNPRILIVDDEAVAVKNLAYALRKNGYDVTTRESGPGGLEALQHQPFDVILTDLRMERVDGMAILKRALETDPDMPVVLITAHGSLDSAVEAMKAGAFHYIAKPFRLDEVRSIVAKALELAQLKRENRRLRFQVSSGLHTDTGLVTQNPAMNHLLMTARQIAATDTTVLVSGESGTGKELLARYIHAHSKRGQGPFIGVNCGALQEDLLANELFGHEKGAYTGATGDRAGLIEAANGGTLFLDEIGEMSLAMQVKLLRVVQEREVQRLGAQTATPVDVRLVTATHRDLRAEVAAGRFRQDLYFRLDVVGMRLPPLAARREDIPLLAFYFLRKHSLRMGRDVDNIEPEAMSLLLAYPYPGNVRELENLIERGVALARGKALTVAELPAALAEHGVHAMPEVADSLPTLAQREEDYIRHVLERSDGNRTRAAQILGIDRVSLWRKLKKYGLEAGEE
ncbi:sigma-54 dependent transcriptional regulator [Candidatus Thiothrix sp. Deng01]|uniref:Sigma-54 dependent transcriptional regulator n=1 Tax=Candidatus Thiothrix phosphatis TaxID=3112415 RepID=A0ABU6D2Q3_9GAMM|nr:sigma-54 dependent transcriptional regulator [Candidatus Thiothrix sp. Deng01]MEB4593323.1 sigma-54 dependent transcriptional regulator [Candidatus Thiothrix sp. Deng01]